MITNNRLSLTSQRMELLLSVDYADSRVLRYPHAQSLPVLISGDRHTFLMSHASSRLGSITSPLLYQLFKGGRACAAASCCLHHHNAAAAASTMPVAEAATTAKAAPVQPSRELAHVRYFIDESVDAGVQDKVRRLTAKTTC